MITQAGVIGAICDYIEDAGAQNVNVRQLNAIIRAATLVTDELGRPDVLSSPGMGLGAWLASDDTGQSSLYMARALAAAAAGVPFDGCGGIVSDEPWPHDPQDFGRCVRLLVAVPELRSHIPVLTKPAHGPVWNAIAAEWGVLEGWYLEDLPTGRSERLYARISAIKDAARARATA